MTDEELLKRIEEVRDDAKDASGCSHEDALQQSLENIASDLTVLLAELKNTA